MPSSQNPPHLPSADQNFGLADIFYAAGFARHLAHDLLVQHFVDSGVSQADLCQRTGMDTARFSRLLNTPSNMTIETLGKLLFAIDGAYLHMAAVRLGDQPPRNFAEPDWHAPPTITDSQGTLIRENDTGGTVGGTALNKVLVSG